MAHILGLHQTINLHYPVYFSVVLYMKCEEKSENVIFLPEPW